MIKHWRAAESYTKQVFNNKKVFNNISDFCEVVFDPLLSTTSHKHHPLRSREILYMVNGYLKSKFTDAGVLL